MKANEEGKNFDYFYMPLTDNAVTSKDHPCYQDQLQRSVQGNALSVRILR